jgi:hypothetical protein
VGAFQALLLAHLLGDFPCQPYPLLRWKIASHRGLLVHVAIQGALALPVAASLIPAWGWWLAALLASHYLIDWAKIRLTRPGWLELAAFFVDQALHVTVLWAIVRLSGAHTTFHGLADLSLRVAIAFILVAYAGAVVVFLVGAALTRTAVEFAPIPPVDRWRGIAERTGVLIGHLLLPAAAWVLLTAAYLLAAGVRRRERQAWVKTAVSIAWALAVTLVAV